MRRNIDHIIDEYYIKYRDSKKADITVSEINALVDRADGDTAQALLYCFEYGYVLGHRHGKQGIRS